MGDSEYELSLCYLGTERYGVLFLGGFDLFGWLVTSVGQLVIHLISNGLGLGNMKGQDDGSEDDLFTYHFESFEDLFFSVDSIRRGVDVFFGSESHVQCVCECFG